MFKCLVCRKFTANRYLGEWLHSHCRNKIVSMYMREYNVKECFHLQAIALFKVKHKLIDQIVRASIDSEETFDEFKAKLDKIISERRT